MTRPPLRQPLTAKDLIKILEKYPDALIRVDGNDIQHLQLTDQRELDFSFQDMVSFRDDNGFLTGPPTIINIFSNLLKSPSKHAIYDILCNSTLQLKEVPYFETRKDVLDHIKTAYPDEYNTRWYNLIENSRTGRWTATIVIQT